MPSTLDTDQRDTGAGVITTGGNLIADVLGAIPLLSIRDLTIEYRTAGRTVELVKSASFEIGRGEIVCLVGESGSGKTITARAIMGLHREQGRLKASGVIEFMGEDLIPASEARHRDLRGRELGMIFQDPTAALDPVMTIGKQIREAVSRRQLTRSETDRRILELIHQVGISDPEHRVRQYPHEISGGMCQRVSIAIALAGDPMLLIADEPTTALDVTIQSQVLELLKSLRGDRGMSVLLVTHDMGVAAQTANRIVVMYAGSIVEFGTTREFFDRPGHPYSLGLIKAVPRIGTERLDRLSTIPGSVPEPRDRPPGCSFHPRCPIAIDRCRVEVPMMTRVGSRAVACHRAAEVLSGELEVWSPPKAGSPDQSNWEFEA